MSPDEVKMKRGVVSELRSLLKKMDVNSLDDTLMPKEKLDVKIVSADSGTESLEKALPKPSTSLDLEAVEGLSKEGMEGGEPKYPSSDAILSNKQKEDRGINKNKDDEDSY